MSTIIVDDIQVEIDDLKDMNTSELVTLCRMMDIPAHRGVGRKVLISALRGKKRKIHNPIDVYRQCITRFLDKHWGAISSQVDIKCTGNCFEHTDFQVITCWKINKETLERHS